MQRILPAPLQAMLWELWRASRFEVLIRFGGLAAWLFVLLALSSDFSEPQLQVIRGILLILISGTCVFSTTWMSDLDNQQVGFTFRLGFTRPISTWQLVVVPMGYSVVTAITGYVVSARFVQWVLGQPMPLFGPSIIIACVACLLVCVTWSSTRPLEKILGLFLAVIAVGGALAARHRLRGGAEPILFVIGEPEYFELFWYEYLLLLLASVLSVAVTVVAVGRQRCGEGWRWSLVPPGALRDWLRGRWLAAAKTWLGEKTRPRAFRGRVAAQCWYEARRSGHVLLIACVSSAFVLAFVSIVPLVNGDWSGPHSPRTWLAALAFCPLAYQFLGTDSVVGLRHKQGVTQLSVFDATRPLRCDQLIAIKLLVVAGWSLVGLLLMGLAAIVHTTIAGQWQLWAELNRSIIAAVNTMISGQWGQSAEMSKSLAASVEDISMFWWIAGLCNLVLFYVTSTSTLLAFALWFSKHPKVVVGCGIFVFVHLCLWSWDASHGMRLQAVWLTYGYLMPMAIIAASLLALKAAMSAGFLSKKYLAIVLCLWVVFVGTTVALLLKALALDALSSIHPIGWMIVVASWLVPLAATASAPLALAAYRHG